MRNSIRFALFCLGLAIPFSSCGVKRQDEPHPTAILRGDGWTAVETKPNFFVILTKSNQGEANAVKALCNNHSYVCLGPEPAGRVITVERKRQ